MAKQLLYGDQAKRKIQAGIQKLARTVKVTLGPSGRNVVLNRSFGGPLITKDGVTVAKEIELQDPFENMGAKLINEVANKTNDVVAAPAGTFERANENDRSGNKASPVPNARTLNPNQIQLISGVTVI